MTRLTCLLAAGILAAPVFAATHLASGTYISGSVNGLEPNTSGTLEVSDDNLVFKAGATSVPVSYSNITDAALGATRTHAPDVPYYKVWKLHKKVLDRSHSQYLTVSYKGESGEKSTMTLELEQTSAPDVLSAIQSHTSPSAKMHGNTLTDWWGDSMWKTARNADKWKQTGTTSAQ